MSTDASLFASVVAGDRFDPALLQDNNKPLQVPVSVLTSLGIGSLYADARFSGSFVCFGGESAPPNRASPQHTKHISKVSSAVAGLPASTESETPRCVPCRVSIICS